MSISACIYTCIYMFMYINIHIRNLLVPTFVLELSFHLTSDSLFSIYIRCILEAVIQIVKPYAQKKKNADFSFTKVEFCGSFAS